MKDFLTLEKFAAKSGYTRGTLRNYSAWGWLPEPCERIGNTYLYRASDVARFMKAHEGRPNARKSVRKRKRGT